MALLPIHSSTILICPLIILLALNLPHIFYRNALTRWTTVFVVVLTSWVVLLSVRFENTAFSYLVGLFEAWIGIWALTFIVIHNPSQDFCRLIPVQKEVRDATKGSTMCQEDGLMWQKFPPHISWERLAWTLDLFINLRGVGWSYRWGSYHVPIDIEGPPGGMHRERLPSRSDPPSLARLIIRFVGQVSWVMFCQVNIFPLLKAHLTEGGGSNAGFAVGLLAVTVSLITIIADIDLLNTTSTLLVTAFDTSHLLGLYAFPWAHPSPWGSLDAVTTKGILGFWGGFWHSYFSYGFKSVADWFTIGLGGGKFVSRISAMLVAFGLSGYMHFCAAFQLPGTSNPTYQFIFFVLQAGGILIHLTLVALIPMGTGITRQAFNISFCGFWLFCTRRFLFEDLIVAGFWEHGVAG